MENWKRRGKRLWMHRPGLRFEALEDRTAPAAGPLVLMGIDAEDGGGGGHGPINTYRTIVSTILASVVNGGTDILVLGGGKSPTDNVTDFWNDLDALILDHNVIFANNDAISTVSFDGRAMIAVVSDVLNTPSGGLTNTENGFLSGRAVDISNFVNAGGGLLGFSQVGLIEPYPYLRELGDFTFNDPGDFSNITPTAAGLAIGITDSLDVCCWHDQYLTFPVYLQVLATNPATTEAVALGARVGEGVTADAGGPYSVDEGGSLQLSGSGTGSGLTFSWDLDGDDVFGETGGDATNGDEVGQNPTFSAANLDGPSVHPITLRVTNNVNQSVESDGSVSIKNVAPTARLSNNGPVNEGVPAVVRFGDQVDPSDADKAAGFHYAFDTNNDGTFDIGDGTYGGSGTNASAIVRGRLLKDGPGNLVVKARIIDKDGDFTDKTTTIVINNVAPVITTLSTDSPSCGGAAENEAVSLSAAFKDNGLIDTHTAHIQWGDGASTAGTVNEAGGSGTVSGSHTYADGGTYVVTLTVTDKDGGVHSKSVDIFVTGVGVNGGKLQVLGTEDADVVSIFLQGIGLEYNVQADFLAAGFKVVSTAGVGEVVVVLCDGDDQAALSGDLLTDALLDGGEGNDTLKGGGGNAVILGGIGDDTITAGADENDVGGRNVLIGGAGKDVVTGNSGEDLLIAGLTAFDGNYSALGSIRAEWSRTDQTYEQRVDHLRGDAPGGLNGTNFLTAATVADDGVTDTLSGKTGRDWFFVHLSGPVNDSLTDLDASEFVDQI